MCYALIQTTFRNEKGTPQLTIVGEQSQLNDKIKEAQSKPEAMKVDVFLHQAHMSFQRVEEWRSKALMPAKEPEQQS